MTNLAVTVQNMFTFLVLADPACHGKEAVKQVLVVNGCLSGWS